jgi:hypothetical protein
MMNLKSSKPINRRLAIVLALASLWLASIVGVFCLIHFNDWFFLGLHGHDTTTIKEIGAYYLALTGAQLTAAFLAGAIIGSSDFKRPFRTTFWIVFVYHLVLSVIRAFHWPWISVQDLDQRVPIIAYTLSILLLIGFSVFSAWYMAAGRRVLGRYFAYLASEQR